jgi:diguanylate cyclase (GGDEF)-like protein
MLLKIPEQLQALKQVAARIKSSIMESDKAIRYGGEEILVLHVDTLGKKSLDLADQIRKNIENESIDTEKGSLKITVSIGVSVFPTNSGEFWKCVGFADIALYNAKKDGRNRAYAYKEGMIMPPKDNPPIG